jgi:hypothetical protein
MRYSDDDLADLHKGYVAVTASANSLSMRLLTYQFLQPKAREFATQGFIRRLNTLRFCIENVFEAIPPALNTPPEPRKAYDCVINLQAFVVNVFGALDNLAWILVHEKALSNDGKPMDKRAIGLSAKNKMLRRQLSGGFNAYLTEKSGWFDELGNFRDAVAHRIPLYVPPFVISPEKMAEYEEIQRLKEAAMMDEEEYDRLDAREKSISHFASLMAHSLTEQGNRFIQFHPQMLGDFNLVVEVAGKVLDELELPATSMA